MNHARATRIAGALLLAAGLALPATQAATADTAVTPLVEAAPKVTAAMAQAMQRDLHLTAGQVQSRLAAEATATTLEQAARKELGAAYGGSYFDAATGKLVVQTTGSAAAVRTAGVHATKVPYSSATLAGVKSRIDALAGRKAPAAINGWYVDTRSDSVVVTVNKTKLDATARAFLDRATAVHRAVRVVEETSSPRTMADIVGAYPYYINNAARCSIGFTVTTGFVSAGHCGTPGSVATDSSGALLGYFQASTFPGNDYSYVSAAGGVNLYGYVYGYDGYYYYVHGSAEMPEGSSICRSGSTTGMWCGTVQAKNQTVNYPQGTVYGLTQTNVCAEPGDSGGSWLSANQAQGVTSGGSGNCSTGGTTFFQPVNPILSAYGLSLVLT
ncbi:MAG TPA: alpha-lytic protease prodomain-containing protein [Actinophytocola sp.]|jgi:streptogrisin C|uniref:alpha-lytic protease prodomain-containing protein n=1 Tax=Actinophytocola sp. TaxID=1872138 RepID=UPI002F938A0F